MAFLEDLWETPVTPYISAVLVLRNPVNLRYYNRGAMTTLDIMSYLRAANNIQVITFATTPGCLPGFSCLIGLRIVVPEKGVPFMTISWMLMPPTTTDRKSVV